MNLYWVLLVGLVVALALGCPKARTDELTEEQAEKEAEAFNSRLRSDFKLPKMFDFERFKSNFKKRYSSALEEMVRAKVFMARAYRAFICAIKYKYRTSPYYLGLNSRTDWTLEELDATLNYALQNHFKEREVKVLNANEEEESLVDPADVADELHRIQEHKNEPGYRELDAELARMQSDVKIRRKREADSCRLEPRDGFDLSAAYEREMSTNRGTLGGRISSNNANYEPQDLATEMSLEELDKLPGWRSVSVSRVDSPDKAAAHHKKLPVKSKYTTRNKPYVVSLSQEFVSNTKKILRGLENSFDTNNWLTPRRDGVGNSQEAEFENKPDVVWVDHRQGGCLQPVQEQGFCGSCWAFATIPFFEWAYCRETGSPIKFSEQYLVDCGSRIDGLNGCLGGNTVRVAPFVHNFGLELARHYPYRARKGQCPYSKKTEPQKMGYMRVEAAKTKLIPLELFERFLAKMPIIISVHLRIDFYFYGGGVYDGRHCDDVGGHAVLVVGHGREDGEEFWLIRNSFSTDWGEQGYMKLNKNSSCIFRSQGMVFGYATGDRIHVSPQRNRRVPTPVHKWAKAATRSRLKIKDEAFALEMQKRLEKERSTTA